MGEIEQNIIQQSRLSGEPLPDNIAKRPTLEPANVFYWHAFLELDTERAHGMGLAKIPRSAIMQYARDYELGESDTLDLLLVVRAVDNAHLEQLAAKREAELEKARRK